MAFDVFKAKVSALAERSNVALRSVHVNEDGQYIARFANGDKVIGNAVCSKVMVKWGSGHKAFANI